MYLGHQPSPHTCSCSAVSHVEKMKVMDENIVSVATNYTRTALWIQFKMNDLVNLHLECFFSVCNYLNIQFRLIQKFLLPYVFAMK